MISKTIRSDSTKSGQVISSENLVDRIGKIILVVSVSLLLFVTANEQSLWLDEVETVSYSDPRVGFAYKLRIFNKSAWD